MSEMADPYLALGVAPTATQAEINHAYRARLRFYHPDTRNALSSQTSDEDLQQLLAAYSLLRDPARRAAYDHAASQDVERNRRGRATSTPVDHSRAGAVQIPVTYRPADTTATARRFTPPFRAGPTRRHS